MDINFNTLHIIIACVPENFNASETVRRCSPPGRGLRVDYLGGPPPNPLPTAVGTGPEGEVFHLDRLKFGVQ